MPPARSIPEIAAQMILVTYSTTVARLMERRWSHHSPVLCTRPVMP